MNCYISGRSKLLRMKMEIKITRQKVLFALPLGYKRHENTLSEFHHSLIFFVLQFVLTTDSFQRLS